MHLANLDNEVFFKKVFTDPQVFQAFVKDTLGVDVHNPRIETEKQLLRKVAPIRFKLDIYAESEDKRILVEIQRIDYDYNFDRFLHYFLAALIDLQRSSQSYAFEQEVYTIVVITAPYVVREKNGAILRDDVLISDLNPRTLQDKARQIYPHKLLFLNPNHIGEDTPASIGDWLQLIHESIENPRNPLINLNKPAIQRAAELADIENIPSEVLEDAKKAESRKKTLAIYEEKAREEGKMEGRIEGKIEGKLEEKMEIVQNAYRQGLAIALIAQIVGLTEDEIRGILGSKE